MMTDVLYLTWEHFEEAMRSAVADLSKLDRPSGVYGIPRGGLIVAATLSHRLSIPWLAEPKPGCILVDDVIETGHTMQTLISNLHKQHPGLHWATWVWIAKISATNWASPLRRSQDLGLLPLVRSFED